MKTIKLKNGGIIKLPFLKSTNPTDTDQKVTQLENAVKTLSNEVLRLANALADLTTLVGTKVDKANPVVEGKLTIKNLDNSLPTIYLQRGTTTDSKLDSLIGGDTEGFKITRQKSGGGVTVFKISTEGVYFNNQPLSIESE